MKILFLCHYFPPEVNAPASRTYENAKRWVQAGNRVTVITCAPNVPRGVVFEGYRNRLRHVEIVDGIRVVRVWTYIAANKGTVRRTLNYLSYLVSAALAAQFEAKPDVLVATSPQFFCGWAGVLVHWIRRRPFVLEIRDIWPESITTVGAMRQGAAIRFLEWMETSMYGAADHIVAVGKGYRDQLVAKGVPGEKVSVVYNGADLEFFQPRPRDRVFRARYGLGDAFVCGYIGTVGMAHGLEILLAAASRTRTRNWKFLVVGDGARLDYLRKRAAAKGLDNLVFTGRLDKAEMPGAWSALDACLIHLRKTDLFKTVVPSKMFEAMAMGVPILMGVGGEAAEMVREAGAGLVVEPENVDAFIAGCEAIEGQGPEAFARAGREFVIGNFNRDNLARQYLGILARVSPRA